jgi:hypothetical protein
VSATIDLEAVESARKTYPRYALAPPGTPVLA